MEIDLPVVITAEKVQADIDRDYERELCVVNGMDVIPDLHKLDRGWISEEQRIRYWPVKLHSTLFPFKMLLEIANFACSVL